MRTPTALAMPIGGVARLYAPNYASGEMLEITSSAPLIYATPNSGLRLNGLTVRIRLRERVHQQPDDALRVPSPARTCPAASWRPVGAFTTTGTSTNWLDVPTNGATFYHVIGQPQPDP